MIWGAGCSHTFGLWLSWHILAVCQKTLSWLYAKRRWLWLCRGMFYLVDNQTNNDNLIIRLWLLTIDIDYWGSTAPISKTMGHGHGLLTRSWHYIELHYNSNSTFWVNSSLLAWWFSNTTTIFCWGFPSHARCWSYKTLQNAAEWKSGRWQRKGPDPIGRSSFKGFFLGGSIYSMLNGGQGRQLSPFGNAYLRSQVPPSKG